MRPMLAATLDNLTIQKYPVMVSPKLDGIRCIIWDGCAVSRALKPIRNDFIRNWLEHNLPSGLDGELIIKDMSFNDIQSAVMTKGGEPDFEFHVFDCVDVHGVPFKERYTQLKKLIDSEETYRGRVVVVEHPVVHNDSELLAYERQYISEGYEGIMLRDIYGKYKFGRSTLKEAYLLKFKRFLDSEAVVLDVVELQNNKNESVINELGLSSRSSSKSGKTGASILGKFKVRDLYTEAEFEIGTGEGLTQALRKEIWTNKESYVGRIIKYKYQPAGQKVLPRFPVWLGFRDKLDLD